MKRIIADGIRQGVQTHVEVFTEDGSIIIEIGYIYDDQIQERFNDLLMDPPPMGGTYYPDPGSMMAAYSVIESGFFDDVPIIEVEGVIGTIPQVEGDDVVY
jgi:hypothetical protein